MDTQHFFHLYQRGVTVTTQTFDLTLALLPVLKGCRNEAGLWTMPIVDTHHISQSLNVDNIAMRVYDLPSIKETV